ncbi:MAG: hypothetical protein ACKVJG_07700 [Candidatus Latescibacterota bacterium]|jgi:hypothetical protein
MDKTLAETFQHYNTLRSELSLWLEQSAQRDGPDRHSGGEDEANYALSWFPHFLLTREEAVAERFRSLLSDLKKWVDGECVHGYEPEAEAHHGTEPFLLFLPRYLGLFPADETARAILQDAAHHIGNWADGVPDWYDEERNIFHSYQIGTRTVGGDRRFDYELAEHWRFVHIALATLRITGEERYRDWVVRYGRRRAEQIIDCDGPLPVLWDLLGRGLYVEDMHTGEQRRMSAAEHHVDGDTLAGIENMLASGVVYALGDLFLLTGDEVFKRAARRLVEPLVGELLDPYADPAAAAISYYRWTFADTSLDEALVEVLVEMPPAPPMGEWVLLSPEQRVRREAGVGKRRDMLFWGQWTTRGTIELSNEPSTAALTLAYQLSGEIDYARRALAQAASKLAVARRILRGGREHADMGGAICSVAAGHGRNWGCGAVTGCYGPLLLGTRELSGAVVPFLEVRSGGVPAEVLVLLRPPIGSGGEVLLFNGGETEVDMEWRLLGQVEWRRDTLATGREYRCIIPGGST